MARHHDEDLEALFRAALNESETLDESEETVDSAAEITRRARAPVDGARERAGNPTLPPQSRAREATSALPTSGMPSPAIQAPAVPAAKNASPSSSSSSSPSPASLAPKASRSTETLDFSVDLVDEAPVDYKGRSRPLYKRQTQRPEIWRPSHIQRLALGLVPGLRLMAVSDIRVGLTYLVPATLTLVAFIYLALRWTSTVESMERLLIAPRWIVFHGAMLFLLVLTFELLRLGAAFEEPKRFTRAPRVLAALLLPALVIVVGAPALMSAWPRLLEAAWFAAAVVTLGAIPAALDCILVSPRAQTPRPKLVTFTIFFLMMVVLAVVIVAISSEPHRLFIRDLSKAAGFDVLPSLLMRIP